MAEESSGPGLAKAVDLSECYFSRHLAAAPGYDVVTICAPRSPERADVEFEACGEEARQKIVRYHLATAAGILSAAGFGAVAYDITKAAQALAARAPGGDA